jgi:hypothetical protein
MGMALLSDQNMFIPRFDRVLVNAKENIGVLLLEYFFVKTGVNL